MVKGPYINIIYQELIKYVGLKKIRSALVFTFYIYIYVYFNLQITIKNIHLGLEHVPKESKS